MKMFFGTRDDTRPVRVFNSQNEASTRFSGQEIVEQCRPESAEM